MEMTMTIAEPDLDGFYHIGRHRMRFEPPDIVQMFTSGVIEPEDFEQFFQLATQLSPDRPIFMLRDAREGVLGPKTRARIIELAQPSRVGGVVNYGASFHTRVVVTMLLKAVRAFKNATPDVAFVETEQDARAWIEAQRKRRSRAISLETKSMTNHAGS